MGKKPKEKAKAKAAATPEPVEAEPWICPNCEQENPAEEATCVACEAPRPAVVDPKFEGYVVGLVQTCEPVPGKDKLKKLEVDVGDSAPLRIVTNASNVKDGLRVVVAKVGAIVGGEPLAKATVGGCPSEGMLCDSAMLGWSGGGAGAAALLPDSFAVGGPPPDARPRTDGK
ncbi:pheT [Symbiodinium natans]|uniref:PheT protein n=1 Tax=Symbiodinium natans TaxID=878477 RepID=A0A812QR72_9DINO|nr:pheT [Symbiodinium natans]